MLWNLWRILKLNISLFHRTVLAYNQDRVVPLGAALAYYTIFSLPAILIIVISLVGALFGRAAVEGEIYDQIRQVFSDEIALQIQNAVKGIGSTQSNRWTAFVGGVVLLFGASGVFFALQTALNTIFGVYRERRMHFLQIVINRMISFGMVLVLGFLLLTSFVLNGMVVAITRLVNENQEKVDAALSDESNWLTQIVHFLNSGLVFFLNSGAAFVVITCFFALVYKFLPDAKIRWRFVFRGALLTSVLFWAGKSLMEYYLSNTTMTTAYGAAGSVVAILLWVFFSAQLIFFGAEYIKIVSSHYGVEITPKAYAHRIIGSEYLRLWRRKAGNWIRIRFKKNQNDPVEIPETKNE